MKARYLLVIILVSLLISCGSTVEYNKKDILREYKRGYEMGREFGATAFMQLHIRMLRTGKDFTMNQVRSLADSLFQSNSYTKQLEKE